MVDFRTGNPSAYVDRAGDCPYGRAETRPAPPTSILTNVYRRRDGAEGTRNSRRCADKWALEARDQGTRVISIGIGPNIDDTALCTWASGKGNEGVYEVNFGNINSILDTLVEDISCGVPPAPPDIPLKRLGNKYDPAPSDFPLDVCEGDCDDDDDCKGCLKCFKRSSGESDPVPGCYDPGAGTDSALLGPDSDGIDFCYAP